MNKVYAVTIKGSRVESRDLKDLLARAVAKKRMLDRQHMLQSLSRGQHMAQRTSDMYFTANKAANL